VAGHLKLTIRRAQLDELLAHCREAYPHEGCGAILGARHADENVVSEVAPLRNAAERARASRFEASPDDVLALMRRERTTGIVVLGFFHSHPDHPAEPSETDRAAAWPDYSYPIVSVRSGEVSSWRSWRLRDDGAGYDEEVIQIIN
jgi:proteasome lid subunit RPN8/RPN11